MKSISSEIEKYFSDQWTSEALIRGSRIVPLSSHSRIRLTSALLANLHNVTIIIMIRMMLLMSMPMPMMMAKMMMMTMVAHSSDVCLIIQSPYCNALDTKHERGYHLCFIFNKASPSSTSPWVWILQTLCAPKLRWHERSILDRS